MVDEGAVSVRAALVEALSQVEGIGTVHNRERYVANNEGLLNLYCVRGDGNGLISGGFVRRASVRVSPLSATAVTVVERWEITLLRSFVDADESEIAFDNLIDRVLALRREETLSGAVDTTWVGNTAGPQLENSEPVMFVGVLCHRAALFVETQRTEAVEDDANDMNNFANGSINGSQFEMTIGDES